MKRGPYSHMSWAKRFRLATEAFRGLQKARKDSRVSKLDYHELAKGAKRVIRELMKPELEGVSS
jgi:hypothetical protein